MRCLPEIAVGARGSKLSQKQVEEVQKCLPEVTLVPYLFTTTGDIDLVTPLSTLGKTDFFTKEIDQALLDKKVRIAIHAAKDLPEKISQGLQIVALTKGVDPSDVLVLRDNETYTPGMKIGVSSERRKALVSGGVYQEIRGTIEKRLALLDEKVVDGVIVAKAALIRLGLLHRNYIDLEGETAPYQGRLAILARDSDHEMRSLFFPLDARKKILSTSITARGDTLEERVDKFILIDLIPRDSEPFFAKLEIFSHLILTSPSSARMFREKIAPPQDKTYLVTGESTKNALGIAHALMPQEESQEGICKLLSSLDLEHAFVGYLRSSKARPLIEEYLIKNNIPHLTWDFYTPVPKKIRPLPDISGYEEIRFSSPSSYEAFIFLYGSAPAGVKLTPKGLVTKQAITRGHHV